MLETSFPTTYDSSSIAPLNTSTALGSPQTGQGLQPLNSNVNRVTANSLADLWIESINVPTSIAAGSLFSLNYVIKNTGTANALASNTTIYLSTDTLLSVNTDTYLGVDRVLSFGAGGSSTETGSLRINSTQAPGNYYLLAVADGDGRVNEGNETNNITAIALTVTKPDLTIDSVTVAPTATQL
jgi:subtilase family serine protease